MHRIPLGKAFSKDTISSILMLAARGLKGVAPLSASLLRFDGI
jgi:hypothetical protein